ncbi:MULTISPECIES: SAM-dependent methyltransferase [unclassified Microbacterium]|uniref:SAM-dependent methyltransferase n=1 Tax=Microbacterium TaxID=33882 RepID=UPI003B9E95A1
MSPAVLFPGRRFSVAELRAACLDGELVPFGEGFLPADAPTPPLVRAAALAPLLSPSCAFVGMAAAWIHGATGEPPDPLDVQRAVPWRITRVVDRRLRFHDQELSPADVALLGDTAVATPARTLADLARDAARPDPRDRGSADAVARLAADESTRRAALAWFRAHPRRTHAVAAVALLHELGPDGRGAADQEDVTR